MTYTIIGIYLDNLQRYADLVEAPSPEEAEKMVPEGVTVAAVLAGDVPTLEEGIYA